MLTVKKKIQNKDQDTTLHIRGHLNLRDRPLIHQSHTDHLRLSQITYSLTTPFLESEYEKALSSGMCSKSIYISINPI
jgi:hypothetical protein